MKRVFCDRCGGEVSGQYVQIVRGWCLGSVEDDAEIELCARCNAAFREWLQVLPDVDKDPRRG